MTKDVYLEKYQVVSLMTKKVRLPCPICGKKITQTYFNVRDHATGVHWMGLKEMYRKYVVSYTNVSEIKGSQHQPPSASSAHIIVHGNASTGTSTSTKHVDAVEDVEFVKWYSGCEYKCVQCDVVHWSYSDILRHLDATHGMTVEEYKAQNDLKNIMTKATHKPCSMCGASGMNCIKIGLPGKSILSKRKGLQEILFS